MLGINRNGHNTNGIYTKLGPRIKREGEPSNLDKYSGGKPTDTDNPDEGYNIEHTIYYGYYPIITENGKITIDTNKFLNELKSVKKIESTGSIYKHILREKQYSTHNGLDLLIPKEIETSEKTYFKDCDTVNKCLLLIANKKLLKSNKIKVYDHFMYHHLNEKIDLIPYMTKICDIYLNGLQSTLFAMYDQNFAYSPCGTNKIMSPFMLELDE